HNAAAQCLARAFEREGCGVTVVDHFRELVSPLFERASRALYHAMLRRAPVLWGIGYALGDWMASDSPLALGVTRLGPRRLGARVPVVLAMAGSRGSFGRLPDVGRALDALERPLHGLLVAGHDTSLRRKLERLTDGSRVRTLGYVEDVRRLMAAADLLVTKAG